MGLNKTLISFLSKLRYQVLALSSSFAFWVEDTVVSTINKTIWLLLFLCVIMIINVKWFIFHICFQFIVILGWLAAAGINLAVLYGPFNVDFNNEDVGALYLTMQRFSWSVGCAWVVFACATGHGGKFTWSYVGAKSGYVFSIYGYCLSQFLWYHV